MYLLNKPKYSIGDYFEDILKGRHDNKKNDLLITRLLLIKSQLINMEELYNSLGEKSELYNMPQEDIIYIPVTSMTCDSIPDNVNSSQMMKVYDQFLVDKPDSVKVGRKVYNSILLSANNNLCPYCSHRDVKTIDHYLPKSKFSYFTVTPVNLIPSCSDCNKDKLDNHSLTEGKMLLHPYYDDINSIDWLECEVNKNIWPITFSYKTSNNIPNTVLKSRINHQFYLLGLDKLYADNATREFYKRVRSMIREYNSNTKNNIYDFLNDNYESYNYENPNSWQTKMFKALKDSEWFIEEALTNLQDYYGREIVYKSLQK